MSFFQLNYVAYLSESDSLVDQHTFDLLVPWGGIKTSTRPSLGILCVTSGQNSSRFFVRERKVDEFHFHNSMRKVVLIATLMCGNGDLHTTDCD